jgi:hypothetical protein
MNFIVARKKTTLFVAVAAASLSAMNSLAQDGDHVRFQTEIVPVTDGTLVPLPNVSAVMTPPVDLSPGAANQLSNIVNAVLAARADGAAFEPRYDGRTWKLAVRTEPRSEATSGLVAPVLTKFVDCIDSLDSNYSAEDLITAAYGSAPNNVAAAKEAAAQLVRNLAEGCVPRPHLSPIDREPVRITVESMLSGHFNSMQIALSEVNTIADILNPPILGKTGLYVRERSDQLRAILTDALSRGLPTESAFDSTASATYETFFDFMKASVLANRGVGTDYLVSISRACIGGVDALYRPFSLSSCLGSGKLSKLKFKLGGQGYVLAAGVP